MPERIQGIEFAGPSGYYWMKHRVPDGTYDVDGCYSSDLCYVFVFWVDNVLHRVYWLVSRGKPIDVEPDCELYGPIEVGTPPWIDDENIHNEDLVTPWESYPWLLK